MNALDQYIDRLDELVKRLSPADQKRLMNEIGRRVRHANKERIRANIQPDFKAMRKRGLRSKYLEGYRKLRKNERIKVGQEFIYDGPYTKYPGEIRTLTNVKKPEHDAKYGFPFRYHRGGGYYQRSPYDPDYVHGFALVNGRKPDDTAGVSKFDHAFIYVADGKSRIQDKLMFRKLHLYKYLKSKTTSHGAAVGFLSGFAAQIAAAHHYGESNRPERPLLGLSLDDLRTIEETLIRHLAEK